MAELQAKGNPKDRGDAEEQITLSKVLRICLKFFFVERKCLVLISAEFGRGLNFFLTIYMNFFFHLILFNYRNAVTNYRHQNPR